MSNNAIWWVRAVDKKTGADLFLSLMSPDLKSPKMAQKRAQDTAKQRWTKKGFKPVGASARCVG